MGNSNNTIKLNTIEEAIADIKQGKVVIVVDDENRENEGDFIGAAEMVTPEMINFMATNGRGLICAPITESRCKELELDLMVGLNTDPLGTAFTVSIDYNGKGATTGISAGDRALTVKAITDKSTRPHDLSRPGHIFPLKAREGGVLRRTGHTEAAIDLARLAGLQPAGVIVEIMNEDGTMARLPELVTIAKELDLKLISIEDLVEYRMQHDSLIELTDSFEIDTRFGTFDLRAYKQTTNNQVHLALTKGSWDKDEEVLVKVNSTLVNNDILGTLTKNPDGKLKRVFEAINNAGKGAVVFINQENQSFNLLSRLEILKESQKNDAPYVPSLKMDDKDFGIGAQILHDLNITKLKVLSNAKSFRKRVGMTGYGIEIIDYNTY
ncbi:3,4-dihydroxy 2-butanone 4-phosphate synthase / GTP cyclohydrolase II [Lutibacter oricola]|uniref:3,4-dihydroxy-2-butanone 4-phosphate synthase n=1 Tax=Lutibacter oricola TaxID=762486 RepID=A0A1H3AQE4_9FLAO|nr:3,4-dihydroxy-2-butanone-4-phosphate synthase [Lutibacter oricola]SDX31354.1 3,4-dihydroxy 2-butanone 4-phosphate synthase / GTP cyclohydrolase II [Lutibacter oricola]